MLSLIFGYNGLGRLEGQSGGPQALGGSNVFGGSTGPLRLLNEALGGQDGWLLGFALVGGVAILAACRLRRSDPRSGWLLAVGGAFATTATVFSFARGIFHPYYVSLLAPFTAALVGGGFGALTAAGSGRAARGAAGRTRVLAVLALVAGVATELAVLHDYPSELRWLTPTLIVLGALGAALLAVGGERLRRAALAGALGLLLLAPATWALDTIGHATSGTFPAGGPADNPAGGLGRSGPGAGPGGGLGGRAGAGPGGRTGTGFGGGLPGGGPAAAGAPGASAFGAGGGSLAQAVRYADSHGGGTVAVASQSEAAPLVIDGERVAGIGGFSGRESETTAAWLAQEVRDGHIRWVLTTSSGPGGAGVGGAGAFPAGPGGTAAGRTGPGGTGRGGAGLASPGVGAGRGGPAGSGGRDQRVGASHALSAVERSCARVSAVSGLYDCAGRAAALQLRS